MKDLKLDKLAMLARTCAVHRVFITPYPATDGGGWWLDIDHKDPQVGRKLTTQRGGLRVFKSVDQALAILRDCGYLGSAMVLPEGEPRPERVVSVVMLPDGDPSPERVVVPASRAAKLDKISARLEATHAWLSAIPRDELSAAQRAELDHAQTGLSKLRSMPGRGTPSGPPKPVATVQRTPPPEVQKHLNEEAAKSASSADDSAKQT